MGPLEDFTKNVMKKIIEEDNPHLQHPAIVYAVVTSTTKLNETYLLDTLVIANTDAGTSFQATLTAHWYEYKVKIIDKFGNADSTYPEIPGIQSRLQIAVGATVAVGFAYGEVTPVIIDEETL